MDAILMLSTQESQVLMRVFHLVQGWLRVPKRGFYDWMEAAAFTHTGGCTPRGRRCCPLQGMHLQEVSGNWW